MKRVQWKMRFRMAVAVVALGTSALAGGCTHGSRGITARSWEAERIVTKPRQVEVDRAPIIEPAKSSSRTAALAAVFNRDDETEFTGDPFLADYNAPQRPATNHVSDAALETGIETGSRRQIRSVEYEESDKRAASGQSRGAENPKLSGPIFAGNMDGQLERLRTSLFDGDPDADSDADSPIAARRYVEELMREARTAMIDGRLDDAIAAAVSAEAAAERANVRFQADEEQPADFVRMLEDRLAYEAAAERDLAPTADSEEDSNDPDRSPFRTVAEIEADRASKTVDETKRTLQRPPAETSAADEAIRNPEAAASGAAAIETPEPSESVNPFAELNRYELATFPEPESNPEVADSGQEAKPLPTENPFTGLNPFSPAAATKPQETSLDEKPAAETAAINSRSPLRDRPPLSAGPGAATDPGTGRPAAAEPARKVELLPPPGRLADAAPATNLDQTLNSGSLAEQYVQKVRSGGSRGWNPADLPVISPGRSRSVASSVISPSRIPQTVVESRPPAPTQRVEAGIAEIPAHATVESTFENRAPAGARFTEASMSRKRRSPRIDLPSPPVATLLPPVFEDSDANDAAFAVNTSPLSVPELTAPEMTVEAAGRLNDASEIFERRRASRARPIVDYTERTIAGMDWENQIEPVAEDDKGSLPDPWWIVAALIGAAVAGLGMLRCRGAR